MDDGKWSKDLLEAGMKLVVAHAAGDYRKATGKDDGAGVFLIEYRDGFKAAVPMLNGWIHERDGDGAAFIFAGQIKGEDRPRVTKFFLQQPDPYGHFIHLVKAIDNMMQTGHPSYPVERTLLTTGILDAVMTSKKEKGKRIETPHLEVKYRPSDWGFAQEPVVKAVKRENPKK